MKISHIHTEHYRIPLPVVLSDSTHGDISHFGLIVTRIETVSGQEGMGYTYCGGDIGGSAILAFVRDDLAPILIGEDAAVNRVAFAEPAVQRVGIGDEAG